MTLLSNIFSNREGNYITIKPSDVSQYRSLLTKFEESFDFSLKPLSTILPLELCLIDVGSGSDTRVMVKKVLAWSEAQAKEADPNSKIFDDECFSSLKENYTKL